MLKSFPHFRLLLVLIIFGLSGCEEQKEKALEYINRGPVQTDPSNLERFGFDQKPTPQPTKKIVIPFDNERTRDSAGNNF